MSAISPQMKMAERTTGQKGSFPPFTGSSFFDLVMRPVRTGLSAAWVRLTAARGAIIDDLLRND